MDMKELIAKVVEGKDLTEEEARRGMEILLGGEATQAQIGAFLTALRMKGETLEEQFIPGMRWRRSTGYGSPAIWHGRCPA